MFARIVRDGEFRTYVIFVEDESGNTVDIYEVKGVEIKDVEFLLDQFLQVVDRFDSEYVKDLLYDVLGRVVTMLEGGVELDELISDVFRLGIFSLSFCKKVGLDGLKKEFDDVLREVGANVEE